MKNMIAALVAKFLGIGKLLEWINGRKSYVAGSGLVLAGLAELLTAALPVMESNDIAGAIAFASGLLTHPGFQKILEGLAVMGLRHAVAKSADAA